jgi:hypothetical protein
MVTIKQNAKEFISVKNLEASTRMCISLSTLGMAWSDFTGFELDDREVLHLHTYLTTPNTISVQTVADLWSRKTGLHVHLQPCRLADIDRIRGYCTKEKRSSARVEEISRKHFAEDIEKLLSLAIFNNAI